MKLPLTLIAAVMLAATVSAQGNANLAGTWTIDRAAAPGGGAARGAITGIPIATTITIRISPGDVTVESDTGSGQTMQTAVYRLDGSSNAVPGPLGWETTAKAAWESATLVVTTRRSMTGPTGPMSVDVKDVFSAVSTAAEGER